MEEPELREWADPVPPYHLHDNSWSFFHPVTTNEKTPNITTERESYPCLSDSLTQFLFSVHHFLSSFSTSFILYPTTFLPLLAGRPCCDKAQQSGRKKKKKEKQIKCCCTIPFESFARSRLHLNRLNQLIEVLFILNIFSMNVLK